MDMEREKGDRVKVLWLSRHVPLPCQFDYLRGRLGDIEVIQVVGHIPNAEYVTQLVKKYGAQYVLPVLPLSFIMRLVELAHQHSFTVLWSEMRHLATTTRAEAEKLVNERPDCRTMICNGHGECRVYEFVEIRRVKAVRLETEPL